MDEFGLKWAMRWLFSTGYFVSAFVMLVIVYISSKLDYEPSFDDPMLVIAGANLVVAGSVWGATTITCYVMRKIGKSIGEQNANAK